MIDPEQTLVSVIIPTYNSAAYLGEALTSVLQQSYQPCEIIVIDDGSTDATPAVVDEFQQRLAQGTAYPATVPLRYGHQANAGPATARNHGVKLAQGNLLAFLDADDWWHPQKLEQQIARLMAEPALGYVFSHMAVRLETASAWPVSLNQAHYQNDPPCILPSALLVRRDVFLQVGYFDEHYRYSDDTDWFLRAKDAAVPYAIVPEPLVYKRIHGHNLSHQPTMSQETMRAFHASVRRQQQAHLSKRKNQP